MPTRLSAAACARPSLASDVRPPVGILDTRLRPLSDAGVALALLAAAVAALGVAAMKRAKASCSADGARVTTHDVCVHGCGSAGNATWWMVLASELSTRSNRLRIPSLD